MLLSGPLSELSPPSSPCTCSQSRRLYMLATVCSLVSRCGQEKCYAQVAGNLKCCVVRIAASNQNVPETLEGRPPAAQSTNDAAGCIGRTEPTCPAYFLIPRFPALQQLLDLALFLRLVHPASAISVAAWQAASLYVNPTCNTP